jgi:hypothetical protein
MFAIWRELRKRLLKRQVKPILLALLIVLLDHTTSPVEGVWNCFCLVNYIGEVEDLFGGLSGSVLWIQPRKEVGFGLDTGLVIIKIHLWVYFFLFFAIQLLWH